MKRDMELIRQMVLEARNGSGKLYSLPGIADDVFAEHVALLIDAGLVEGKLEINYEGGSRYAAGGIQRLTWAGQEFAKGVEDGARWAAARDYLLKQGGIFTLDLLLAYLKGKVIG